MQGVGVKGASSPTAPGDLTPVMDYTHTPHPEARTHLKNMGWCGWPGGCGTGWNPDDVIVSTVDVIGADI